MVYKENLGDVVAPTGLWWHSMVIDGEKRCYRSVTKLCFNEFHIVDSNSVNFIFKKGCDLVLDSVWFIYYVVGFCFDVIS